MQPQMVPSPYKCRGQVLILMINNMLQISGTSLQKGDVIKILGKRNPPMVVEGNDRKVYYFQCEINNKRCFLDVRFFSQCVIPFYNLVIDRAISKETLLDFWLYIINRKFVITKCEYRQVPIFDRYGCKTDKTMPFKKFYLKHLYKNNLQDWTILVQSYFHLINPIFLQI